MASIPMLGWRAFQVPRAGHAPEECEDAFAVNNKKRRFVVADGASESSHGGEWARLLATGFANEPGGWTTNLQRLQQLWAEQHPLVGLPWYLEEQLARGAFATLLCVRFDAALTTWQAVAVGDSCLFHLRDDCLLRSYPLEHAADFDASPALVCSVANPGDEARTEGKAAKGAWQAADRLLLATDALAAWLLREVEQGRPPWALLPRVCRKTAFADWIAGLRAAGELRNDDVTLLCIEGRP